MSDRILIVRLGAMGDILHALPAAESLKRSFSGVRLIWVTRPRWFPLFTGNPFVDELIPYDRHSVGSLYRCWRSVRSVRPTLAFDFQGLVQSALVGRASRPRRFWGFHRSIVRESMAAFFYTDTAAPRGPHRLERNLQLVYAAGASVITDETWLPEGAAEGDLPTQPYVLASPFAGWKSKQWPLRNYSELAQLLGENGLRLVLNVSGPQRKELAGMPGVIAHESTIAGLIHATRKAAAVVGVDSGPMHLAAALRKPGVAIFGPTDPASNGPYGGTLRVLRAPDAVTSYAREDEESPYMRAIEPKQVCAAVFESLRTGARL